MDLWSTALSDAMDRNLLMAEDVRVLEVENNDSSSES
jgi:hypothetical protein